jgi:hypothetical protein
VPRRRVRKTPRKDTGQDVTTGPFEDLLEQCQRAVGRVLAELPPRDREVLEEHRARVVEVTHRETRAALEEIQGVLERVA